MQVMMLVAQNGVPRADLGTATSAVTFLRQIGASAGVAVVGAMITLRFTEGLPPAVVDRPAERPGCRPTTPGAARPPPGRGRGRLRSRGPAGIRLRGSVTRPCLPTRARIARAPATGHGVRRRPDARDCSDRGTRQT